MRSTKVPEQTLHRSVSKIYLSAVVSELILGNRRAAAECRIAKLFPRLCRQMNIYEGTTQEKNAAHRNPLTHVVFCAACDSLFKGIVNQGGGGITPFVFLLFLFSNVPIPYAHINRIKGSMCCIW